jgi:predicted naringenin-chalcone synthase
LAHKFPGISYVDHPVNAGEAGALLAEKYHDLGKKNIEIRMMHLSLHHLEPAAVQAFLQDSLDASSHIFIGDLAPNLGGVLFNGQLSFHQFVKVLPGILIEDPIKILLIPMLPLIMLVMWHDATVSVMRSYSHSQLMEMMVEGCTSQREYRIQSFQSVSYAEYLGIPPVLPLLRDPVMQFFWAVPSPHDGCANSTGSSCMIYSPTEKNSVVQTITREEPDKEGRMPFLLGLVTLMVAMYSVSSSFGDRETASSGRRHTGPSTKHQCNDDDLLGQPAILAIGTAVTPHQFSKERIIAFVNAMKDIPDENKSFHERVVNQNGIDYRHFGFTLEEVLAGKGLYGATGNPGVIERHRYWAEWAPKMAIEATRMALDRWGGDKREITHVVFHSCTGFKAPGVELDIIDALGLTGVKRRLGINFMGCFGGFTGMSVAKSFVLSDPDSRVLLVCAELSGNCLTADTDRSKNLCNAIFGDGAAAVIVGPGRVGDWVIGEQVTRTLGKETRGFMKWSPTNYAYEMYLSKKIGWAFGSDMFFGLKKSFREAGFRLDNPSDVEWCVHPGGRKLLDQFCSGGVTSLGVDRHDLRHSYEVLRTHGNMSSPTIFFIVQRMIEESDLQGPERKSRAVCLGFGPGLTVEIAGLHRVNSQSE